MTPFLCDLCNKPYKTKDTRRHHVNSVHLKRRDHKCNECGKSFYGKFECLKHKSKGHVKKEKKIPVCEICKKVYSHSHVLRRHVKWMHSKICRIQCEKCDMKFNNQYLMLNHLKIVHEREKPFPCHLCEKRFGYKSYLKNHIKTVHLQQRDHKCEFCTKTFKQRSHASIHMSSVHLNIKPFQCDLCDRSFAGNSLRKKHKIEAHSDLKPFRCQHCGSFWKTLGSLNSHIKRQHFKQKKCNYCLRPIPEIDLKNHISRVHKEYTQCYVKINRLSI